jgi:hypothetical protein
MEKIKEDWNLSEVEKQTNYELNLTGKVAATAPPIDTLHTFFGHEDIQSLPENVARPLHGRLEESIRKLTEIKNNFENGNPYLKNDKKVE